MIAPRTVGPEAKGGGFGIGQPVRRREDVRFLTGQGTFTDDLCLPGQAYGVVLRAPHAAAAIGRIDVAPARAVPGVLLVLTATDLDAAAVGPLPCAATIDNRDGSPAPVPRRPVLAGDAVRHVGEAVAFVVADTLTAARSGAEAIEVDYRPGPAIVATAEASRDGAPLVHGEVARNIAFDWEGGDPAATRAAFARAAHVTSLSFVNNRLAAAPIETRAANAEWDGTRNHVTLHTSTQGGWDIKRYLAEIFLHLPAEGVTVRTPDVGGGFGMKAVVYPEQVLCAFAARALGRPVKWTAERAESFVSDTQGRDHVTRARLALDADDRIIGLDVETTANMGAYLSEFAPFVPTVGAFKVLPGIYDVKAVRYAVTGVFTNTVPVDAYRGAGRPESNYMIERLVDRAARERGYAPADFRRRNMIPAAALPFRTASGEVYDSGDFAGVLDAALARADAAGFAVRREASRLAGAARGLGIACYIESTMGQPVEHAAIAFTPAGRVSVAVGTQSNGQGHETAYAQVLAARLGIPFSAIDIVQGDTDLIASGGGTGGSRSLTIQAAAINAAAAEVVERARALAATLFEVAAADIEFADGAVSVKGTDVAAHLMDLATRHPGALDARAGASLDVWTYPNGCHVAEVEIDRQTGTLRLERYTIVDDFGLVVNPLLVEGQVIGGVVQGLGQALMEHAVFDEGGQPVAGAFTDYAMPRAAGLPAIDFSYVEFAARGNGMGIKGCGEAGTIAAPPAAINAVVDALWRGPGHPVPEIDMPASPQRLWAALGA